MKTNNEVFDIVMERKGEYETRKAAKMKRLTAAGVGIVAIALCVGIGVAAQKGSVPIKAGGENQAESGTAVSAENTAEQTAVTRPDDPTVSEDPAVFPSDQGGEAAQTTKIYGGASVPDEGTNRTGAPAKKPQPTETTTAQPKDGSGSTYGGDTQLGGWMIPCVPAVTGAQPGVKVVGEKITDAEARAYLMENTWIGSALAASGVPADNLTYSETGYCHVSYDGVEGKQLELRQNFRDYLAYSDGELVAIITLTKENGRLSATPAFGGPWFSAYDAFLNAHKGEKLLYVYAGFMEIIITPDNRYVNPQGTDVSAYFEGVENPYEYFYNDAATYTP
ncbi:MAG: hypothetical protein IJT44_05620 [Clostridia bacterium]|nr:hypothetical protein [Clostridia bacterium]